MSRYTAVTDHDRAHMLATIGANSIEELFERQIPACVRLGALRLPDGMARGMGEQDVYAHLRSLAARNVSVEQEISFMGAGMYDHYVPALIDMLCERSELLTPYTPYQPEISQGGLQVMFEYQTAISELTGLAVSNASVYEGPSALAAAAYLAKLHNGRRRLVVSAGLHPYAIETLRTYAHGYDMEVVEVPLVREGAGAGVTDVDAWREAIDGSTSAAMFAQPNFYGAVEDAAALSAVATGGEAAGAAANSEGVAAGNGGSAAGGDAAGAAVAGEAAGAAANGEGAAAGNAAGAAAAGRVTDGDASRTGAGPSPVVVAQVDPITLGVLRSPGECGVDVAVGEGQPLGNRLDYGGPSFGLMAAREEYLRRMPGRIAGDTTDVDGRRGFVLTLQTREQHIRRERATSNICTAQALNALAGVVYLAWLGRRGIVELGELLLARTHYARTRLTELPGVQAMHSQPAVREFALRLSMPGGAGDVARDGDGDATGGDGAVERAVREGAVRAGAVREGALLDVAAVKERCARAGVNPGVDIHALTGRPEDRGGLLIALTERRSRADIDRLVDVLEAAMAAEVADRHGEMVGAS